MTPDEKVAMLKKAGVWDVIGFPSCIDKLFELVAAHEREKPVTVPANGLRQQEPSRSTPTGSQSNEIVPVGYVDAMFRFQTCQEHYVSPSDRFKPVYTAKQIEVAVLAERELCAHACDEYADKCAENENWEAEDVSLHCAAAIRSRNEK